jgi:hypothetical protein
VESPPLRRKRARMGHPGHPQSESFSCSGIAELRSAAQTRASGPTWVVGWAYVGCRLAYVGCRLAYVGWAYVGGAYQ